MFINSKLAPCVAFLFACTMSVCSQAAEPVLVKDINNIADADMYEAVVIGNFAYFQAEDPVHGDELWKTDGTSLGTVLVKDIYPGRDSSLPEDLKPGYFFGNISVSSVDNTKYRDVIL